MKFCLLVHEESTGEGSAQQEKLGNNRSSQSSKNLIDCALAPGKAAFQGCATSVLHPDKLVKCQY